MPYADPEKQRQARRESYARRRATDPEFRRAEIERSRAYIAEHPEAKKRGAAVLKAKRQAERQPLPAKACVICGEAFTPTMPWQLVDSDDCKRAYVARQQRARRAALAALKGL